MPIGSESTGKNRKKSMQVCSRKNLTITGRYGVMDARRFIGFRGHLALLASQAAKCKPLVP